MTRFVFFCVLVGVAAAAASIEDNKIDEPQESLMRTCRPNTVCRETIFAFSGPDKLYEICRCPEGHICIKDDKVDKVHGQYVMRERCVPASRFL